MAELKGVVDVHGNGSFQNQTGEVRGAEIGLIRHISVRECSLVMCIPISACAHPHWVCML